jgi:DUF1365 family protein
MNSAIYQGRLRHRRHEPVENHFDYPLFMMYLDLEEVDQVFSRQSWWGTKRPTPARFMRGDYLDPQTPDLATAVRNRVEAHTGARPSGPIRMLTHCRYLGHCFNPVTFYYCFDRADQAVETVIAEITNTPWKERHAYVLPKRESQSDGLHFRFRKAFHVSPFNAMEQDYDWRFSQPGRSLAVSMVNREGGQRCFDATLSLKRRPLSGRNLATTLLAQPAMTMAVVAGIHWQALRLWWKRSPFYSHPKTRTADTALGALP